MGASGAVGVAAGDPARLQSALVKLENDQVTFRYRATDTGEPKLCTLSAEAFIHRFLQHVLHYSTTLNIKGESYRLKEKRRAGLLGRISMASDEEPTEAAD